MALLPRYTPAGITIAAPQPLTTAPQAAAASLGRTVSAGLDRISNFAFRQAYQQAAVEGREYGAEKAPTIEQIKQAQEDGEPLTTPGDTTTVFGRAARAQGLATMRLNVESAGRAELAQIHAKVINTEVPVDQYASQMNDVIKGYGDAIAQASPRAAGALRASLATVASMQYRVHATGLAKKAEARRLVVANETVNQIIEGAGNIVRSGIESSFGIADGDEWQAAPVESILASERNRILKIAYSIGDAKLAKAALKQFNDKIISEKKNLMVDYTKGVDGIPDYNKHDELWSNNISDPQKAAVWNTLDVKQKQEVRDTVIRVFKQSTAVEESRMQYLEKKTKQQTADLEMKMIIAINNDDPVQQGEILNRFKDLNASSQFVKYSNMIQRGDTWESNVRVKRYIEQQILFGRGQRQVILDAFANKMVSPPDTTVLLTKLAASQNATVNKFSKMLRQRIGYESDPLARLTMSSSKQEIARRTYNTFSADLQDELEKSIREKRVFDPSKMYANVLKKWNEENTEDNNKISGNLDSTVGQLKPLASFGITPPSKEQLSNDAYLKNLLATIEKGKKNMGEKNYSIYKNIILNRRKQISGK